MGGGLYGIGGKVKKVGENGGVCALERESDCGVWESGLASIQMM